MSTSANDLVAFTKARTERYRRLWCERTHLLLIDDAKQGFADIIAGHHVDADDALSLLERAREAGCSRNNASDNWMPRSKRSV